METVLTSVGAGLFGLVTGLLAAARLGGRSLTSCWRFSVQRRRDWLVPVLTTALCVAFAVPTGLSVMLPALLYLVLVCVALAAVDIEEHRLPDVLTLPSYPIALALLGLAAAFDEDGRQHFLTALIGMVGLWLVYLLLHLINPAGMGWGDVKLAGVLGAYLGWFGLDAWITGTFLGVMSGGLFAVTLLALQKVTAKTPIPFGPFLIGGALASLLLSVWL